MRMVTVLCLSLFIGWPLAATAQTCALVSNYHKSRNQVNVVNHGVHKAAVVTEVKRDVLFQDAQIRGDFFFSVGDYYRDRQVAERVVGELSDRFVTRNELAALVKDLRAAVETRDEDRVDATMPKIDRSDDPIQVIFDQSCLKCHSGSRPSAGLNLEDASKLDRGKRWEVYGLVNSGEMPQSAPALPDVDVKKIYEWARSAK